MISKHLSCVCGSTEVDKQEISVGVKKLTENAIVPHKDNGNIGWDFHTNIDSEVYLYPGERHKFSTGIALELPAGYAMMLWDRSGLSSGEGLHRLAGVIDSIYRGEILVCLVNLGQSPVLIKPGQKIVQGIIQEEIPAKMVVVDKLSETSRGDKGFGSTGK